jgi:2-polyprenyl-6-hydroxyphenyl methylase / 3-demethylubiquinone-9 3-methyltransferase
MAVNNQLYEEMPHHWWDEDGFLHFIYTGPNPARFAYFRSILERLNITPIGLRVLDIGSGGGFLAESFAAVGASVTGVDPASNSVLVAQEHAAEEGHPVDYCVGSGEWLPFADQSFDVVACCDVLEHVDDLNQVLSETARVLKPGGLYFYDTINRTPQSWLLMVQIAQKLPLTRVVPSDLHDWSMFIRPEELEAALSTAGLRSRQVTGLNSSLNPLHILWQIVQLKVGQINQAEFGHRLKITAAPGDLSLSYMGYAIRAAG